VFCCGCSAVALLLCSRASTLDVTFAAAAYTDRAIVAGTPKCSMHWRAISKTEGTVAVSSVSTGLLHY
jgi:hypothetical protein